MTSGTTDLIFTVTLSPATNLPGGADFVLGVGSTATPGTDYVAFRSTRVTFPPGTTTQPFNVKVMGDTTDEANETIVVTLLSPGSVGSRGEVASARSSTTTPRRPCQSTRQA